MLLHKAADDMAPRWWLIPNFMPCKSDSTKVLRDTVRIMDQLTHYHMLIRLHLPYIFSSSGQKNNHSKITAINASREILSRHNAFRTSNPAYFVFLTSTSGANYEDLRTRMRTLVLSPSPTAARVTVAPWNVP